MIDALYALDISLFRFLNQTLVWSAFDVIMPVVTDLNHLLVFRVLVILGVVLALWKGGGRGRRLVLLLLIAVTVSDQVNSFILKELLQRSRPCHELFDVRLLVDCGAGKSFPSSHAVNAATIAVVVSFFYPRALALMFVLAGIVAYSRVYVGVHYPSDVLAGLVLGGMWGWAATALFVSVEERTARWISQRRSRRNRA